MKTSNKLILIFFIALVSLMLISDIVLWANFKRGVYGNNLFGNREENYKPRPATTLQPFKVIKMETDSAQWWINVELAEQYSLHNSSWKDTVPTFYRQVGDTLFVHAISSGQINIHCPAFTTLIMEDDTKASINRFEMSALTVKTGARCRVGLNNTKFASLDFRGGLENAVVFDYGCEIDTLHMALGKGSEFRANDVPFKQVDMELDQLASFNVDGRSISAMKQIK